MQLTPCFNLVATRLNRGRIHFARRAERNTVKIYNPKTIISIICFAVLVKHESLKRKYRLYKLEREILPKFVLIACLIERQPSSISGLHEKSSA